MPQELVAYKGDTKLKSSLLKEVEKHRRLDQIEQGTYGHENGKWKGCAVACSLRSLAIIKGEPLVEKYSEHARYESDLGIPEWLARLEDTIFENLPVQDAKKWPSQFIKAIPVGAKLEPVKWTFCAYLMKENIEWILNLNIEDDLKKQVVGAIQGVLKVHEKAIKTGEWDESAARSAAESARSAAESAARSAESAAWSAARSAAWSAWSAAESAARSAESAAESAAWSAWSAAESAARSAAWSAWSAARSAARSAESAAWSARSAARSAAWSAAESATFVRHSKELLKLLKAA